MERMTKAGTGRGIWRRGEYMRKKTQKSFVRDVQNGGDLG